MGGKFQTLVFDDSGDHADLVVLCHPAKLHWLPYIPKNFDKTSISTIKLVLEGSNYTYVYCSGTGPNLESNVQKADFQVSEDVQKQITTAFSEAHKTLTCSVCKRRGQCRPSRIFSGMEAMQRELEFCGMLDRLPIKLARTDTTGWFSPAKVDRKK